MNTGEAIQLSEVTPPPQDCGGTPALLHEVRVPPRGHVRPQPGVDSMPAVIRSVVGALPLYAVMAATGTTRQPIA